MRIPFSPILVIVVLLGGTVSAIADTVTNPVKRQESLERAKALVAAREIVPVAVDPFYSQAFANAVRGTAEVPSTPSPGTATPGDTAPPIPAGPRGDRELLQAIAKTLTPSGSFIIGGAPQLTFGQKRVKAGGVLTITFEGNQHTLEIVSIDRTTFTLRLNREEFTRTIK